jgi:hypothetical protein
MAVSTALKSYGQAQVASASKRDIRGAGEHYEAERGRQAEFTKENEGTVADTLNVYSPQSTIARQEAATDKRGKAYTSPLASKNFVAPMTADAAPNSVVNMRNLATGQATQAKSIAQALAKAKLDAYGDAETQGSILGNINANKISMVQRIARGSQRAGDMQQGTLQSKLAADAHQGDTFSGLGDLFSMAAMVGTGGGWEKLGTKFGFGGPASGAQVFAPGATGAPRVLGQPWGAPSMGVDFGGIW